MSIINSQSRAIVFITRKWHGTGGMQQHSQDLATGLQQMYGERFLCLHPAHPGLMPLCVFVFQSMRWMRQAMREGGQVLLGDCALLLLPGVMRHSRRVSVITHGLDVIYPIRLYQSLIRRRLKSVRKIVCVSRATASEVRSRGVPDDRIVIIPCGIPLGLNPVQRERDPVMILSVGRLVPRKGQAWFVREVLPLIRREIPGAHLVIIGSGPEESRIRATAKRWGLEDCVEIRTACRDTERNELLSRAALFVMPNIIIAGDMEGFGIACIEAAACGLQVLAADSQGIPDTVIEGKTGMLYKTEDSPGCAALAVQMLKHPLDAADIERAARNTYDWQVLLPRFRDEVFD